MQSVKDRLFTLGLWPRMALAISLGFLVLFVAFMVLSERALRDSQQHLLEERLAITKLVASQIDSLLLEATAELQEVDNLIRFNNIDIHAPNAADRLQNLYGQIGLFRSGMVIMTPAGVVLSTYPEDIYDRGADLSHEIHVAAVLAEQTPTISDPFLHPIDAIPVTAITAPIENERETIGLLTGLMRLDGQGVIMPLYRAKIVGQTEHAVLVDAQGRALASTFQLPFLSPGEHQTFYQTAMEAGEPVIDTAAFELDLPNEPLGHRHVMAFAPLEAAPWGLAVGGDLGGDAFAGIQRLRIGMAMIGIFALSGVWLATMIGTRRLVRPVHQLTESAHRIASGDLNVPLQIGEGGELGVMASALDDMRQQLLNHLQEMSTWNASLEDQVAEKTAHLQKQQALTQKLLQQIISAQEGERRRVAYELHDEVGQMLTAVTLSLKHLENGVTNPEDPLNKRIERSRMLVAKTISDLRAIIAALRPTVLDQLGLEAALAWICDTTLRPLEIDASLVTENLDARLSGEIETILFRIAQEAVHNIARHSQATAATIFVRRQPGAVRMKIEDNGIGLQNQVLSDLNCENLGLAGMRERAALAGGAVTLHASKMGGVAVDAILPLTESILEGASYGAPTD